MSDRSDPIGWMQCRCYVWPIYLGQPMHSCGLCWVKPHTFVAEPPTGRAMPLDQYRLIMEGDASA